MKNLKVNTFTDIITREVRHYCAHLFAHLLYSEGAVVKFFNWHSNKPSVFEKLNYEDVKIFFEFTALREYLSSLRNDKTGLHNTEKQRIENEVFGILQKGDVSKKKPDMAFYFKNEKVLILIEAKFETGFNIFQIKETHNYGLALASLFPRDIKEVHTTLLGFEYYLDKDNFRHYPNISWEKIHENSEDNRLKKEIDAGLNFQSSFKVRALKNWKNTRK